MTKLLFVLSHWPPLNWKSNNRRLISGKQPEGHLTVHLFPSCLSPSDRLVRLIIGAVKFNWNSGFLFNGRSPIMTCCLLKLVRITRWCWLTVLQSSLVNEYWPFLVRVKCQMSKKKENFLVVSSNSFFLVYTREKIKKKFQRQASDSMFTKPKNQMLCLKSDRNDKLIMNLDAILFLTNLSHYISLNDCSFKLCIDINLLHTTKHCF